MKKKIHYTDEPVEFGPRIDDLLPPPEQMRNWGARVTVKLEVDSETLEYFRELAGSESPAATAGLMSRLLSHYATRQRDAGAKAKPQSPRPTHERRGAQSRAGV